MGNSNDSPAATNKSPSISPRTILAQVDENDLADALEEQKQVMKKIRDNIKKEKKIKNEQISKLQHLKQTVLMSKTDDNDNDNVNVYQSLSSPNLSDPSFAIQQGNTIKLRSELHNISPLSYKTPKAQIEKVKKTLPSQNRFSKKGQIQKTFIYQKSLAKGGSCRVLLCQHRKTHKLIALKQMIISTKFNPILFLTEAHILKSLQKCKNIITFFDAYMDSKYLYIATEYLSGGTLLNRISQTKKYTEKLAVKAIKTILETVQFIHSKKIYHRDLKPNNLVYSVKGDKGVLTMIDFGTATMVNDNEFDNKYCGTLPYFTPEMIKDRKRNGKMIRKGDIWCVGVISFVVLTGHYPFMADNKADIELEIVNSPLKWPKHVDLSDECKSFVSNLLNKKWHVRPEASEALQHEWILNDQKARDIDLGNEFQKYISDFKIQNKLERILINAITNKMNMDADHLDILLDQLIKFNKNNKQLTEENLLEFLIFHQINEHTAKEQCKNIFEIAKSSSRSFDFADEKEKEFAIDLNDNKVLNDVFAGMHGGRMNELDWDHSEFQALPGESSSSSASASASMNRSSISMSNKHRISVGQFRYLVEDVDDYNMEQVIADLDPDQSGFIDLHKMCQYSGAITHV